MGRSTMTDSVYHFLPSYSKEKKNRQMQNGRYNNGVALPMPVVRKILATPLQFAEKYATMLAVRILVRYYWTN